MSPIRWPKRAAGAIIKLFRPVQDVDVYVEDVGDEALYSSLLRRLAPPAVRVERVFAAGNRAAVIEQARTHDFKKRRALFLVDGDFEWVRGEPPPAAPGLHRLDCYCIENILVSNEAAIEILMDEKQISREDASKLADFEGWRATLKPLVKLFVAFSVLNKLLPSQATVSSGVGPLLGTKSPVGTPALDAQKVESATQQCHLKAKTAVPAMEYQALTQSVESRVALLAEPLHIVSGKDFIFPLFHFHLRARGAGPCRRDALRFRAARHCSLGAFARLARDLDLAARQT